MSDISLHYWNDRLAKSNPRKLSLQWSITGAKTASPIVLSLPVLYGFDAGAFASQAAIDAFLGTTNEFLLAAFDSTAMGTDAFAAIVKLNGQGAKLLSAEAKVYSGTNGLTASPQGLVASTALTSSSHTAECALGANGNMAVRIVNTGLDAITSGLLVVNLDWISA